MSDERFALVESLLADAWSKLAAADAVIRLSEANAEDVFVWSEKDGMVGLASEAKCLLDRMRSRGSRHER